jgi:hypothetical protein
MDKKNDINRLHSLLATQGYAGGLSAMKKTPDVYDCAKDHDALRCSGCAAAGIHGGCTGMKKDITFS